MAVNVSYHMKLVIVKVTYWLEIVIPTAVAKDTEKSANIGSKNVNVKEDLNVHICTEK